VRGSTSESVHKVGVALPSSHTGREMGCAHLLYFSILSSNSGVFSRPNSHG